MKWKVYMQMHFLKINSLLSSYQNAGDIWIANSLVTGFCIGRPLSIIDKSTICQKK
jgi:hypothetical protein